MTKENTEQKPINNESLDNLLLNPVESLDTDQLQALAKLQEIELATQKNEQSFLQQIIDARNNFQGLPGYMANIGLSAEQQNSIGNIINNTILPPINNVLNNGLNTQQNQLRSSLAANSTLSLLGGIVALNQQLSQENRINGTARDKILDFIGYGIVAVLMATAPQIGVIFALSGIIPALLNSFRKTALPEQDVLKNTQKQLSNIEQDSTLNKLLQNANSLSNLSQTLDTNALPLLKYNLQTEVLDKLNNTIPQDPAVKNFLQNAINFSQDLVPQKSDMIQNPLSILGDQVIQKMQEKNMPAELIQQTQKEFDIKSAVFHEATTNKMQSNAKITDKMIECSSNFLQSFNDIKSNIAKNFNISAENKTSMSQILTESFKPKLADITQYMQNIQQMNTNILGKITAQEYMGVNLANKINLSRLVNNLQVIGAMQR
jgi:hypothetical protein